MNEKQRDTDLLMVCISDISGQVRGKAMPRFAIEKRRETGVGWTPTNVFITSFGAIAPSPWGPLGDLMLRPDFSSEIEIDLPDDNIAESFVLGDILELDGTAWACCLRSQLKHAIDRLEADHGLRVNATFEHEFFYSGTEGLPGLAYGLRAYRRLGAFPNRLMRVLDRAGLGVDTFMPEFGPGQCEVTIDPRPALRAADEAVILRELVRATARSFDTRASFTPMVDPDGVGNGVHIHFSFEDLDGNPVSYDPARPAGISEPAGAFIGGILRHLPDAISLCASSVPSYMRLTPNRWCPAFNNLGLQHREAAVRVCPVFGGDPSSVARKFHFEFRAADGTSSPYIALAAVLNMGLSGLDDGLTAPKADNRNMDELGREELAKIGITRLSQSLPEALGHLQDSTWARSYFGDIFVDAFLSHKTCEAELMEGLDDAEIVARYKAAY